MNTLKINHVKSKKALYLYMGFFSCMVIGASCNEKSISNSDVIPEVDNIHTFEWKADSLTVDHITVDTLWTSDNDYPLATIGKITNDPFFGKTTAGLFIQFGTPTLGFRFTDSAIVDSSTFSIPYFVPANNASNKVFYGDTSAAVTFNVHRITEPWVFNSTKRYYAHDALSYSNTILAQKTIKLNDVYDTVTYANGSVTQNLMSIRLPQSFTNEIVNLDPLVYFTDVLKLQEHLSGFYIGLDPNSSANLLATFNVNDGTRSTYKMAQLNFYYRFPSDTTTRLVEFPFTYSTSGWFNAIKRDYTSAPAQNYRYAQNSDSLVVQSAPGINATINIPIRRIPNSIINKAEVVLTVMNVGLESLYTPPTQLLVKGVDNLGTEYNIADYYPSNGFEYIGGTSVIEQVNGSSVVRYRINFPRELQKAINEGKTMLKLKIAATTSRPGYYRALFHGPSKESGLRPEVNVIYTIK